MSRTNSLAGRTWDEIHGHEKAEAMRAQIRLRTSPQKGKTYEEIYGLDRADSQKKSRSEGNKSYGTRPWGKPPRVKKGTTYEERYGLQGAIYQRQIRSGDRGSVSRIYSTKYINWRKAVLERDQNTCQQCGHISTSNHAHHLVPWKHSEMLRFSIPNGQTLCISCHARKPKHLH